MKINMNNYEAYLLDYEEGNLDKIQTQELMLFLKQHPGLYDFDSATETPTLEPDKTHYPDKAALMQPDIVPLGEIDESNYEERFIAYHEHTLSEAQRQQTEAFLLQNPSLTKEFRLYGMTKLNADANIVFKDKGSLLKKTVKFGTTARIVSIAASMALLIGISWHFATQPRHLEKQDLLTELTPIKPTQVNDNRDVTQIDTIQTMTTVVPKVTTHKEKQSEPLARTQAVAIDVPPMLQATETGLSEAYCMEHGINPEKDAIILASDYTFAMIQSNEPKPSVATASADDNLSLIGKGVSLLSDGRYNSLGDMVRRNIRHTSNKINHNITKTTAIAYYKIDCRIEEFKDNLAELKQAGISGR